MHAPVPPAPSPGPRLKDILILGSLTAFGAMSIDLYLPALPTIGGELAAAPGRAQLTLSAFFVGMALGQLFYGPAADRLGRRPILLAGAGVYVAASLGCALASSIELLAAGRLAQGFGAACGLVIARAVVRDRFDHRESARILSLLTLVMAVAPMLAPSLGALLLATTGWRAIFLTLAGFGALVGLAVLLGLPESRSPATAAQAAGESTVASYRELLRHRRLNGYLLAGALQGAVLFSYIAASPELIITIWGFSPAAFGWIFPTLAVGVIGGSQINRALLRRWTPDAVLRVAAPAGLVAGLAFLGVALAGVSSLAVLLGALFLVLASYGFMAANTTAGALAIDPLRAGSASALIGASSFVLGAIVSTLVGLAHDGTPVPMAVGMALALAGSAAALFGLALRSPEATERS